MKTLRVKGYLRKNDRIKEDVIREERSECNCMIVWQKESPKKSYHRGWSVGLIGEDEVFDIEFNDDGVLDKINQIEIMTMDGILIGILENVMVVMSPSARKSLCNQNHDLIKRGNQYEASCVLHEDFHCAKSVANEIDNGYNQIDLLVDVAPVKGSGMLKYVISSITCQCLPFLAEDVFNVLKGIEFSADRKDKEIKELVESKVVNKLASFGFGVGAKVVLRMGTKESATYTQERVNSENATETTTHLAATAPQRRGTSPSTVEPCNRPECYEEYANLYVDLGSTNGKWIVENVAKDRLSLGFRKITFTPTSEINGEWGIDYDKPTAYSLTNEKFKKWLTSAALGFMRHVQKEEKVNIVNITWSFPKLFDKDGVHAVDFDGCSKYVSEELKRYGLGGTFELLPEGLVLKYMFVDVLRTVAKASEDEVKENQWREKQEQIIAKRNEEEQRKHDESVRKRNEEERAWKMRNWWHRLWNTFQYETDLYVADKQNASLGRLEMMKAFRNTGARGDGNFDILLLDAGGSTLDFCFLRYDSDKPISGSYDAGGNRLTQMIQQQNSSTFSAAEDYKFKLMHASYNKKYDDMTVAVYQDSLADIVRRVSLPEKRSLCVVVTGLAMFNPNLRKLIRLAFRLTENQLLAFSPDMVDLFTTEMYLKYPKLKDFSAVVCQNDSKMEPWPAFDVAGGLYFYKKGVRNA